MANFRTKAHTKLCICYLHHSKRLSLTNYSCISRWRPYQRGNKKINWHGVPLKNLYILKLIWNSALIARVWACRNCLRQLYFKSKWRGIGYSFQLAITAPLYSITGYCIATAQSCQNRSRFHPFSILPRKSCWIQKITLHDAVWELTLGSNVKFIVD